MLVFVSLCVYYMSSCSYDISMDLLISVILLLRISLGYIARLDARVPTNRVVRLTTGNLELKETRNKLEAIS